VLPCVAVCCRVLPCVAVCGRVHIKCAAESVAEALQEQALPHVRTVYVDLPTHIFGQDVSFFAHHSDVIRLHALLRFGGTERARESESDSEQDIKKEREQ